MWTFFSIRSLSQPKRTRKKRGTKVVGEEEMAKDNTMFFCDCKVIDQRQLSEGNENCASELWVKKR